MNDSVLTGAIKPSRTTTNTAQSRARSYFPISYAFAIFFLLTGCVLLQYLYNNFFVWILVPSFLLISACGAALTRGGKFGMHACILTYSICVLIAALAQNYSSVNFGKSISTSDAILFYNVVLDTSYNTIEALSTIVNAPLAVYIWKFIYQIIGTGCGPLAGVLFNAALMGVAGALTVKSANILFGDDARRLYKVGILFSTCGLVWLFGSLFLRDSYAVFFNALVLWALLKCLNRPSITNIIWAGGALVISGFAMEYIREGTWHLFMALAVLAIGVGFIRGRNPTAKLFILGTALVIGIIGYSFIENQVNGALKVAEYRGNQYTAGAEQAADANSLGAKFVTSQPVFIRATIGSAYILIMPIPAWGYLQPGLPEYILIKGYHAVYMLVIMPLLISGIKRTFKLFLNRKKRNLNYTYTAIYFLATLMSVAATSLETRHLGQFASSMVLLAALPGTSTKSEKMGMRNLNIIWFITIAAIYLAWTALKLLR